MPVDSTNFDILLLNPIFQDENDYYQAGYRLINRMVCVYGEITFEQLFSQNWDTLMPQLATNVDNAVTRGYMDLASSVFVNGILEHLATNNPTMTFGDFIRSHGGTSI